jgi:hypothetical protein
MQQVQAQLAQQQQHSPQQQSPQLEKVPSLDDPAN